MHKFYHIHVTGRGGAADKSSALYSIIPRITPLSKIHHNQFLVVTVKVILLKTQNYWTYCHFSSDLCKVVLCLLLTGVTYIYSSLGLQADWLHVLPNYRSAVHNSTRDKNKYHGLE
jgi:hypothetical protein